MEFGRELDFQKGRAGRMKPFPRVLTGCNGFHNTRFGSIQRGIVKLNEQRVLGLYMMIERATQYTRLLTNLAD